MNHSLQRLCAGALLLACPGVLLAHGGHAGLPGRSPWWTWWTWDPLLLANLALLAGLYARGVRELWRRGTGRGLTRLQATAFALGVLTLVAALVSPLDALSEELSAAHMVQHMLLMNVAAPLVVLGSPARVLPRALPARWARAGTSWLGRSGAWRLGGYWLWQPLLAWSLYALVLWLWHLPALYQAALRNGAVHDAQHLTFFAASCLFWRVLLDPLARARLNRGAGVVYLFATSLHATVLGVFMALAPRPWYPDYAGRTAAWGLSALEDQQVAGLIMWMPACLVYAGAAATVFGLWLRELEKAVGDCR